MSIKCPHCNGLENTLEEYFTWLYQQISKMFNISLDEIETYSTLLITDNENFGFVNLPNITIINRQKALEMLQQEYSAIIDVTNSGTAIQLSFVDTDKYIFLSTENILELSLVEISTDNGHIVISYANDLIANIFTLLGNVKVLFVGYTAHPLIKEALEQTINSASPYPNTNLAWELSNLLAK